jgi:hypothetical protein
MLGKNKVLKVPFYGNEILVIEKSAKRYVPMKPIVEGMGLDWSSQIDVVKRDHVLNSSSRIIRSIAKDGKCYEMRCIPLEYLIGWLCKIPACRYSGKKRETIIKYQKECYQALHDYLDNNEEFSIEELLECLLLMLEKLENKNEAIQLILRTHSELADIFLTVLNDDVKDKRKKMENHRSHIRKFFEFFIPKSWRKNHA